MIDITNEKNAGLLITISCKSTGQPQSGQEPFVASHIQPMKGRHSRLFGLFIMTVKHYFLQKTA